MTGNYRGDSNSVHYGDVDWIVMDGVEYFGRVAHLFTENPVCCVADHRPVTEGNTSFYPIHEDIIEGSHTNKSFSHNVPHLEHITDSFKSHEDTRISKPNIDEVQQIISAAEAHISSLKSKLQKYIRQETRQSSGDTPEPLHEETEVQEEPASETALSEDEMEEESSEQELELSSDKREHPQRNLSQRKEQSPGKDLQGSSNITGRLRPIKHRCTSEVLEPNISRDTEKQHPLKKSRRLQAKVSS